MNWTNKQEEAISTRGKNMLVAAAAGSGKTAVLVERIKQLIISEKTGINEMLVVTFTNAAAAEMKEKIVSAITAEIEKNNEDADFLLNQLNNIYKSNISTFHSFALEIIRRYFYIINIEPNFKICDDAENIILKTEAMDELFDSLFESDNQDFINFLNKYSSSKNEKNVKDMIEKAYGTIRSIPESFLWLQEKVELLKQNPEEFLQGLVAMEIMDTIVKNLKMAVKSFNMVEEFLLEEGLENLAEKARQDVEQIQNVLDQTQSCDLKTTIILVSEIKYQRFNLKKEEKDYYEEIKPKVEKIRDRGKGYIKKIKEAYGVRSLDEYVEEINMTYGDCRYFCLLIEEYHKRYMDKKEEKNLVDFNDIEHMAIEILKTDSVANEYREKFKHIFIDEYQDSNLLQEALIGKIKRENNLFMVGDVKQSIYKFRLAEPEIFMTKYEKYKSEQSDYNLKIDLNQNFRSKGNIINGVNLIFSSIMNRYDQDAALYQGVAYEGAYDYPIDLHVIDEQTDSEEVEKEILDMKMAEIEAYNAVKLIKQELKKEIFDVKLNKVRDIKKRDIVILLRATRNYADKFHKILTEENLPCHLDDSEGYFDTIEIEIILNLLRVIDNKRQDLPLLSILHSPIMDFSIEELSTIRSEYKKGSYFDAFERYGNEKSENPLSGKILKTIRKIENWQQTSKFIPLDDFIWQLLTETGYYNYAAAMPSGVQRQANLRLLIDKAVKFQKGSIKGLYGFISYIDYIKAKSVRTGQISLVGENDDVIRIMTIHKSKGLEFPIVLVAGLGRQFNLNKDTTHLDIHKDFGISISNVEVNRKYYSKTLLQNAIRDKNKSLDLEEEIRILYVAFTRAMDHLILLGTLKNLKDSFEKYELVEGGDISNARSFLDMILPSIEGTKIKAVFHNKGEIEPLNSDKNLNKAIVKNIFETKIEKPDNSDNLTEVYRKLGYSYLFPEAVNQKSKISVSEINKKTSSADSYNNKYSKPRNNNSDGNFTAAEKGTITHNFMRRLDFAKAYNVILEDKKRIEEYLENQLEELVNTNYLTKEERNTININKVIAFLNSPIGKRAAKAKEIHKEAPFSMLIPVNDEEIIVQGIIDCYFKENEEYVLIDYKTNYIFDEDYKDDFRRIKEIYNNQVKIYCEAVEASKGIKVKEAYLYLFEKALEIEMLKK